MGQTTETSMVIENKMPPHLLRREARGVEGDGDSCRRGVRLICPRTPRVHATTAAAAVAIVVSALQQPRAFLFFCTSMPSVSSGLLRPPSDLFRRFLGPFLLRSPRFSRRLPALAAVMAAGGRLRGHGDDVPECGRGAQGADGGAGGPAGRAGGAPRAGREAHHQDRGVS